MCQCLRFELLWSTLPLCHPCAGTVDTATPESGASELLTSDTVVML